MNNNAEDLMCNLHLHFYVVLYSSDKGNLISETPVKIYIIKNLIFSAAVTLQFFIKTLVN